MVAGCNLGYLCGIKIMIVQLLGGWRLAEGLKEARLGAKEGRRIISELDRSFFNANQGEQHVDIWI